MLTNYIRILKQKTKTETVHCQRLIPSGLSPGRHASQGVVRKLSRALTLCVLQHILYYF